MHWTGPWTNQLLAAYPLYSFSKMFWGLLIFAEKPVSAVLSDVEAIGEGQFDIYTANYKLYPAGKYTCNSPTDL